MKRRFVALFALAAGVLLALLPMAPASAASAPADHPTRHVTRLAGGAITTDASTDQCGTEVVDDGGVASATVNTACNASFTTARTRHRAVVFGQVFMFPAAVTLSGPARVSVPISWRCAIIKGAAVNRVRMEVSSGTFYAPVPYAVTTSAGHTVLSVNVPVAGPVSIVLTITSQADKNGFARMSFQRGATSVTTI